MTEIVRDGSETEITRFGEPQAYWGEIPQSLMHEVLEKARSIGWRDSVEQLVIPN